MGPRLRRKATPLLALALLIGAAGCEDETKISELERQKAALEATTLPKEEFWAAATRKGEALQRQKKNEVETASLRQEIAALRSRREAASSAEQARARAAREAAEADLRAAQADLARADAERAQRQAALQGFESRRRAGAGS